MTMIDKARARDVVSVQSGIEGDRNIDDFELFYARRALRLVKERLGHDGVTQLLADDIERGNEVLRRAADAAAGRFVGATVRLSATGLSAAAFLAWLGKAFADESVLLAAHPEHWGFRETSTGALNVVETIGSHASSFLMGGWGVAEPRWAGDPAFGAPRAEFSEQFAAELTLSDGTVFGRVMCQFGDTETGFACALSVAVPAGCDDIAEQHLHHFAVEFRNWIVAAANEPASEGA